MRPQLEAAQIRRENQTQQENQIQRAPWRMLQLWLSWSPEKSTGSLQEQAATVNLMYSCEICEQGGTWAYPVKQIESNQNKGKGLENQPSTRISS